ncbi:MAG TPA: HNH endonuclease [Trebonia sp.]|jgi:DNA-binding CsgD family transcriptional regulator|nr:HNH endonuclease [Trebonia sp.]
MTIRALRPDEPVPAHEPKRYLNSHGYVRLRWLIGSDEYVEEYEHRIVMGRPDGHVHHRNHVRDDNRPENLQVLTSGEHQHIHGAIAHSKAKYGPYGSRSAMDKAQRAEKRRQDLRARAEEMGRLYADGLTTIEIADRFGVHHSRVNEALHSIGIQLRTASDYRPAVDHCEVRRLHADGVRASEMCRRLGIGRRRLYQVFDDLGLSRFGPGNPHHGEVEAKRDPHDLEAGYRLESSQDPGAEAVMLASEHGSGVTKYLTETGTYSDYPPGGDAA